jgi:glutamyl-tRNA reductase
MRWQVNSFDSTSTLFVAGFNYRNTPLQVREQFSLVSSEIEATLNLLKKEAGLQEVVLLSTCNRTEIYGVATSTPSAKQLFEILLKVKNSNLSFTRELESALYVHEGLECVSHLSRVASGFDSMVFGETEILGQVKKAYERSLQLQLTGKVLNRFFQSCFSTVKKVRTESGINRWSVSVGSVSVELASQIFGSDLSSRSVLVVGSGKIGSMTLKHLAKNEVGSLYITNRSPEKANALAKEFGANAIPWESLEDTLSAVDIVISSTGAAHPILHKQHFERAMKIRKNRPLFVIDLALPRDIEAAAREVAGVYLFNLDELSQIVNQNFQKRQVEAKHCEELIKTHSEKVFKRLTDCMNQQDFNQIDSKFSYHAKHAETSIPLASISAG